MPRLTDKTQLERILSVLARWDQPRAICWLARPREEIYRDCHEITLDDINYAMYVHVRDGGEINRVPEKTPSLAEMGKKHFDEFRITVGPYQIYLKTRLAGENKIKIVGTAQTKATEYQIYVYSAHKGHDHDD